MENKKKIIHEGELQLGGLTIPCYILDDGTRVLSGRGMQNAIMLSAGKGEREEEKSGVELTRFVASKWFSSLIENSLELEHFRPIICYKGNQKINGYEATTLADFCNLMLDARANDMLTTDKQKAIAAQCEILIRAFAKVGIIALVDEATGYQYDRERFELQRILNAYISDEILKWQLTFTDDFYKEVYRLWGLPFIPKYIKNKPSFIGKLTTKYIYEQLPTGIIEKIKDNTGKTEKGNWRYKWHQSLTPEIGREHLKKQIIEVTTLMSIAQSKEQFNALFKQKYNKEPVQLELEFNEEIKEPKLSEFDKKLKTALNFNPKDKKSK
jgi:hypothetical protein